MDFALVPQLIANGVVIGVFAGALGYGLVLILGVTGRFHFAYGLTFTGGAYAAAVLASTYSLNPWLCLVIGMAVATVLGHS